MKKLVAASIILSSTALLSGCASSGSRLVLDRVGPPSRQTAEAGSPDSHGVLVVYSAYDACPSSLERNQYSDYKVLREDGTLLKRVKNDDFRSLFEEPTKVKLPEGRYRIVAHSNGYGIVTVPVLILANQVTTLHLEGGASWPDEKALEKADPVRLPEGEIVGWRASEQAAAKP